MSLTSWVIYWAATVSFGLASLGPAYGMRCIPLHLTRPLTLNSVLAVQSSGLGALTCAFSADHSDLLMRAPANQWAARHKIGALPFVHQRLNLRLDPLSTREIFLVDVGHATVFVACRNVATQTAGVRTLVATFTCGRLHRSRSCTLVQRNAGDSLRTPGTQHQVRQPSLAQIDYPGVTGWSPHYSVLGHSCVHNANAHTLEGVHSCGCIVAAHVRSDWLQKAMHGRDGTGGVLSCLDQEANGASKQRSQG